VRFEYNIRSSCSVDTKLEYQKTSSNEIPFQSARGKSCTKIHAAIYRLLLWAVYFLLLPYALYNYIGIP